MNHELLDHSKLQSQLPHLIENIQSIAEQNSHDEIILLTILRSLEAAHRHIRSNLFEKSLPKNRHDLYNLVRDIEEQGGWPYIERMKLKELMQNIDRDLLVDDSEP